MPVAIMVKQGKDIFRSKLEWRFTRFFDSLGIAWEYEPDFFDLTHSPHLRGVKRKNHLYYLPDFYLPQFECYLEVKPRLNDGLARLKMKALADHTRRKVFLSENFYDKLPQLWWYVPKVLSTEGIDSSYKDRKNPAMFSVCTTCQKVSLAPTKTPMLCCGPSNYDHPALHRAVRHSRQPIGPPHNEASVWKGVRSRRKR